MAIKNRLKYFVKNNNKYVCKIKNLIISIVFEAYHGEPYITLEIIINNALNDVIISCENAEIYFKNIFQSCIYYFYHI